MCLEHPLSTNQNCSCPVRDLEQAAGLFSALFSPTCALFLSRIRLSLDPSSESVSLLAISATTSSASSSDPSSSSVESPQAASIALVNRFPVLFPPFFLNSFLGDSVS
uniref:Uncharacterized protein n=1 Tax=Opuntia streptacantha TaxID=393608 RepID=A0A7C9CH64_OPUST